jgi:addiction module RelB/DinJ family antitoxin
MEKTATLNLRVNPTVKERAEKVLSQLGVPMSTAIDMYLNQISLTGGIPFSVSLPKAPVSIHADAMTTEELHQKLEKGYSCRKSTKCSGSVCKIQGESLI